jgi:hypothetical protein
MATRIKACGPVPESDRDRSAWRGLLSRLSGTGFVRLPDTARPAAAGERVADDFVERLVVGAGTQPQVEGLAARLAILFAGRRRVTLGLAGTGPRQPDAADVREQLELLATRVAAAGHEFAPAAIAVPAHWLAYPEIVQETRGACGGCPDVFAVLPADFLEAVQRKTLLLRPGTEPLAARSRWAELLDQATADPRVHLVPEETAAPVDPLMDCRAMHAPEPALAQPVTAGGARVRIEIDMAGLVRETRCRSVLVEGFCDDLVRLADGLLDAAAWPSPSLAARAVSRRRLALHLRELGEAATILGGRPASLAALRRLGGLLATMGSAARRASRRLADDAPASNRASPGASAPTLRHSHLLVWRPWDFLPPGPVESAEQEAHSHLFPLMKLADCPGWRRRGVEDSALYGRLLRLAWASWRLK